MIQNEPFFLSINYTQKKTQKSISNNTKRALIFIIIYTMESFILQLLKPIIAFLESLTLDEQKKFAALLSIFVVSLTFLTSIFAKKKSNPIALPLDGKTAIRLPLERIVQLSKDTKLLRFTLPTKEHAFGLPTGSHVMVQLTDAKTGEKHMRPYTPVSSDALDKGHVDFVVKVYFPNKQFPEGGKVSQMLDAVKVGEDTVEFFGPLGGKRYVGGGEFTVKKLKSQGGGVERRDARDEVGMIAGGSGITPMLQIVREMLRETGAGGQSPKKISILYANKSEEDILCRDTLDNFEKQFPGRVKVWYTVDAASKKKEWKYDIGFITKEMIEKHLPTPAKSGDRFQILVCGPPPMMKFAVNPAFEKLEIGKEHVLTW